LIKSRQIAIGASECSEGGFDRKKEENYRMHFRIRMRVNPEIPKDLFGGPYRA